MFFAWTRISLYTILSVGHQMEKDKEVDYWDVKKD